MDKYIYVYINRYRAMSKVIITDVTNNNLSSS